MSRFKTVVPVPLGEIRRIEGKLGASALAGQLLTASDSFAAGNSLHAQSDGATFALNGVGNSAGVMILMEQEDMVTASDAITVTRPINTWGRAHVLKKGEEVTVILASAEVIAAGDLLDPAANGKVRKGTTGPLFTAIETNGSTAATGDSLRILARVL